LRGLEQRDGNCVRFRACPQLFAVRGRCAASGRNGGTTVR
jgi:hypothetical protein